MNFTIFIQSLNNEEVEILANILHQRRVEIAKSNIKPLTVDEMLLSDMGYHVEAVMLYRRRNGGLLLEAKEALDRYKYSQLKG